MSNNGDEELERRLRDVLNSRGLGVPVPPDAIDRIHAGARRRQQLRTSASALGAIAIIAIAAVAIGVRPHDHRSTNTGALRTASPSPSIGSASSPAPASPSAAITSPTSVPSSVASLGVVAPTESTIASTPPTQVFYPLSVSAVGVHDYWVLGYNVSSDGGVSTAVKKTTDAGQTFTAVGSPAAVVPVISYPPDTATVYEVRFGDANNGWAFGSKLFQTADGGVSWSAVTDISGGVVDLVAANGVAWAVVDLSAGTASSAPARYALYSTAYGKAAQHWTQAQLPIDLGATQPSIVDQDGTVTIVASGPLRSSNLDHALVATNGGAFTDHVGPCSQDLGGYLSNSALGVWALCPSGSMAGAYVSSDRGATWTAVPNLPPPSFPNPGAGGLGAIDNKHAVLFDLAANGLVRVTVGGSPVQVNAGPTSAGASPTFIGFTTPSVGFAIVPGQAAPNQLWRTTDGGQTWSAVTF